MGSMHIAVQRGERGKDEDHADHESDANNSQPTMVSEWRQVAGERRGGHGVLPKRLHVRRGDHPPAGSTALRHMTRTTSAWCHGAVHANAAASCSETRRAGT